MMNQPGGATHLTSMMTQEFVKMNLAEINAKLSPEEQQLSDEIRNRYKALMTPGELKTGSKPVLNCSACKHRIARDGCLNGW